MKRAIREIDRFTVRSEEGKTFELVVYQHYIITESFGEPPEEIEGTKDIRTAGGQEVNVIDKGSEFPRKFRILAPFGAIEVSR